MTSCISFTRNIKVNKDGSGSEVIIITYSKTFMDIIISLGTMSDSTRVDEVRDSIYNDDNFIIKSRDKYNELEGITITGITSVTNPDSSKTMTISYDFLNITDITRTMEPEGDRPGASNSTVTYVDEGDHINFRMAIEKEKQDDAGQDTSYTSLQEAIGKLFEGEELIFNFDFDYDVISSNATSQDGRSLIWVYNMADVYKSEEPIILEAVLQK